MLQGIELLRRSQGQHLLHHADALLRAAAANLSAVSPGAAADRHWLAISVAAARWSAIWRSWLRRRTGPDACCPPNDGLQLWLADPPRYGAALLFATGSPAHVEALQSLADQRGLRLDQDGLFRGEQLIPCAREVEVYAALGLPFIEPELREGQSEIELAWPDACLRL